jgi:succinate dehydrogenase / fumarate reductase flavoprotein subunit
VRRPTAGTALAELDKLRERAGKVSAPGGSVYNPGWHLALDPRNMLLIAECVAQAALERQESRGGHTRDDYPCGGRPRLSCEIC